MSFTGASRRPLAALSLMTVGLGLVLAAACSTEGAVAPVASTSTIDPLAQVPKQVETDPTMPFPPGYVPVDARGVNVPHLAYPDLPQAPVPVFGGDAHMTGTVFGPDGPVDGAVVRLERFVGSQGGFADVRAGKDGTWSADSVYGGKYRVRAWAKPSLATTEPQLAFVTDAPDTTVNLSIGVEKHDAVRLQAALSKGDPHVGEPVTLLVLHDQEDVDDNGIVRGKPLPNVDITLQAPDGLEVSEATPSPQRTGLDGFVRFVVTCTSAGAHDVIVSGDNQSATVTLPECLAPDAGTVLPTTTSTEDGVSGGLDQPADFPIGQSFTTPYKPLIPAGTYRSDGEATCSTDYDQQIGGDVVRQHTTGRTLALDRPARNLEPSPGSKPCTFRRTE